MIGRSLVIWLSLITMVAGGKDLQPRPSLLHTAEPYAASAGQQSVVTLLAQELSDGEAHIWYLGHCGWAVRTRTRFLVFDYWEQQPFRGERSLADGRIDPAELRDLDVYVFVSHAHGDHYDPTILSWAQTVPTITYLFGWTAHLDLEYRNMGGGRVERSFDGMAVSTVSHEFDGIPEVAYLVRVDGLVIYHSGDHASTSEVPNATYTDNIDFFAGKQERVDLVFLSTFGRRGGIVVNNGDLYAIDRLKPRAVFPMHHGGGEDLNQRFVDEMAGRVTTTEFVAARQLGDRFFYSDGQVRRGRL
jgi:L-ascorbate metabolism protein UlaG (beta-lactamase superfamily)